MKIITAHIALCAASTLAAIAAPAAESAGPTAITPITQIIAPKDHAYAGEIQLAVDATDNGRRIVHVHETLSGIGSDTVLFYPKWLPGTHAPEGPIDRIAGIRMTANGAPVSWTRDPADVYAFRVHPKSGTQSIDIDFDYLSPTSAKVGALEMSRDLVMIEWNELVLYPAGYFARQIPVQVSLTLPTDFQFASALEAASADGGRTLFKRTTLETLIDSPVYAGRYASKLDLDPGSAVPVHLDLFADRPELLAVKPEQLEAHRALVRQAYKLFASHHYNHYDFLYSLSDQIQENGLEHHQSSEDGSDPESFTKWDKTAFVRDLLAHEFTHSWNGKFRRPADLWTPNYNVPMQDSLLWVYEGQTQYWGQVLAARSGLRTRQEALDQLAITAAHYEIQKGREWRTLQDTTNDEIINPRRPQSWPDWQRFEDYYEVGQLIWLDADTLIRERSNGARVAQIMKPRRRNAGWDSETKPRYEAMKSNTDGARIYRSAAAQSKKRSLWVGTAVQARLAAGEMLKKERLELRTKGHQSALVELGLADNEHTALEVDVLDAQSTDFPDTQPQAVENGEDHVIGVAAIERAAPVGEGPSGCQQSPCRGLVENEW